MTWLDLTRLSACFFTSSMLKIVDGDGEVSGTSQAFLSKSRIDVSEGEGTQITYKTRKRQVVFDDVC